MKKYYFLLSLILFSCLFFLTGCYSGGSIESYYYVTAIGIDKATEENMITLTVQIAKADSSGDSSSGSSAQSSQSILYSVDCSSVNLGINIFNNYLSKKLNLSHCSAIIFSEDISKEGITNHLSTLVHNTEVRPNCNVIICNETSKKALECISNSEEEFSARLYSFIANSVEYTSYSTDSEITNFYTSITDYEHGVATYLRISEDKIQNDGIAVFKGDKFITSLKVLDAVCYSIIENRLESCIFTISNPFVDAENLDVKIKLKIPSSVKVDLVNNTPYITIDISIESALANTFYNFDYSSEENIDILEHSISEYLEEIILDYLYEISHELNTDICGFKSRLANNYLTTEEFEKIEWEKIFPSSYFDVNITSSLSYNGLFIKD